MPSNNSIKSAHARIIIALGYLYCQEFSRERQSQKHTYNVELLETRLAKQYDITSALTGWNVSHMKQENMKYIFTYHRLVDRLNDTKRLGVGLTCTV